MQIQTIYRIFVDNNVLLNNKKSILNYLTFFSQLKLDERYLCILIWLYYSILENYVDYVFIVLFSNIYINWAFENLNSKISLEIWKKITYKDDIKLFKNISDKETSTYIILIYCLNKMNIEKWWADFKKKQKIHDKKRDFFRTSFLIARKQCVSI